MNAQTVLTENVVADAGSIDLLISSNATVNVANIGTEFVTIGNITNGNIAYASITTSLSLLGRSNSTTFGTVRMGTRLKW